MPVYYTQISTGISSPSNLSSIINCTEPHRSPPLLHPSFGKAMLVIPHSLYYSRKVLSPLVIQYRRDGSFQCSFVAKHSIFDCRPLFSLPSVSHRVSWERFSYVYSHRSPPLRSASPYLHTLRYSLYMMGKRCLNSRAIPLPITPLQLTVHTSV